MHVCAEARQTDIRMYVEGDPYSMYTDFISCTAVVLRRRKRGKVNFSAENPRDIPMKLSEVPTLL